MVSRELLGDKNPKYDILIVDALGIMREEDKKSVGIERSRDVIKFVKDKPLQHTCKVVLILEGQFLTVDAQNALLKTLEEPPQNTYLILTAPKKDSLLTTIVSRCRLLDLGHARHVEKGDVTANIFVDKGAALDWLAESKELLEEKENIIKLLEGWENHLREDLPKNVGRTATIERLWSLRQTLQTTNASPRLAIEEFLLRS